MEQREVFRLNRAQSLILGLMLLGIAVWMGFVTFPLGSRPMDINAWGLVVATAAFAGGGLWFLARLRNTAVQVVVDREGITDFRVMPDPIPWAEVERCELYTGMKGGSHLRLALRPGSQAANRIGKTRVVVNDMEIEGGTRDLRQAIARLAPQVPRDW
ncbi:MAG TPA: hypothetical protein PKD10_08530 [Paracoccaceae bacterium]|nr:hypothetical protein [Paracoccaceae bacterium]HMO70478.1 hypothetical protein [Paracoccaceae bacterium]